MARTKVCPRANPPSSSSPSPSPNPSPTLPPPPPLLHVTSPAFKSVPSAPSPPPLISIAKTDTSSLPLPPLPPIVSRATVPAPKSVAQIVVAPPRKKIMYPGPFIKGQVGSVYFSLDKIRSYMEIPHRYSIIIQNFHMRYKFEPCYSKYVLIDPLGNKWEAPEVFEKWRQCVETNTIQDLDLNKTCLAIVRYGNTFRLCTSVKKNNYKDQTHPIPAEQLAEEDPREQKDPDYVPPKEEDDSSD